MAEVDKTQLARAKAAKNKHDLHVLLLMETYALGKTDAINLAYVEGFMGLADRMPKAPGTVK